MRALAVALAVAAPALAGCLAPAADEVAGASAAGFDTSRGWSLPLSPALYGVLELGTEFIPVRDGVEIAVGVFAPEVEGCSLEAAAPGPECRFPTIIDAGPYYGDRTDVDKYRPPTIEWLVPRGYVVLQMALRGTGESGGCLEYKSLKDVDDVSDVIDSVVARPWSNGAVGMIGRSYDGTSAWAGAASGNPALKAIVPISGAVDGPFLYFKNGTSEARAPANGVTYWPTYGLGLADGGTPTRRAAGWTENACKEALLDVHAESWQSTATGDASSEYWTSRDLTVPILANYRGAAWVVHGLHDWNVNPSQAVPFVREMREAGIATKAWLGVWGHAYPDRVDEHRNVRWDWAEQTVQWFDWWLVCDATASADGARGRPCVAPDLAVEVEDSLFTWRREETYPPADATFVEFEVPGGVTFANVETGARFDPLEEDLRIAGLPQVHVDVVPSSAAGGYLFAELYDVWPDGRQVRIGWGAMNLRFAGGGNTDPVQLVPGQAVRAHLEMEPVDAHVASGHALRLVLHRDGVEDILPSPDPGALRIEGGLLRLPTVVRDDALAGYAAAGLG